ncbi:MAG: TonB-dependent receptor [Chitinophagaceae bacterium]
MSKCLSTFRFPKQRLRKFLLFYAVGQLLCVTASFSQKTVSGIVLSQNNIGIPATIQVKGKLIHAVADTTGHFSITAVPGDVLVATSIGYAPKEISVTSMSTPLQIILTTSDASQLDEVIVVGYGTQKKKDLTGPVSHIGEEDFKDRPLTQIDQALAAKMPGVQVQAIDGAPGAAMQIRVRGSSSISASNDPLYVVDGVPVSDLQDIDPSTVESIDVLKDASTASIYGARGSNGVILITTKKGQLGKPVLTFTSNVSRSTPERLVKMMDPDEWIQFRKDLIDSNWVSLSSANSASDDGATRAAYLGVENTHEGAASEYSYMYDPYWAYGSDSLEIVNWEKAFYRPAYMERASLSVRGSNNNITYMLTGDYTNQTGMAPNSGYNLYGLRSNLEIKLSNNAKVGLNLAPTFSRRYGSNINGKSSIGSTVASYPMFSEKGVGLHAGEIGYATYAWVKNSVNPIYVMENTLQNTQLTKLMSNLYVDLNLAKGLNLRTTGAWNSSSSDYKYYQPTSVTTSSKSAEAGAVSTAKRNTSRIQYYLFQSVATYNLKLNNHSFNTTAGTSIEQNYTAGTAQTASGFSNDNLYTFTATTSENLTASTAAESQRRQASFFARLNYFYSDRYLLSFSVRRDGISRFSEHKYGTFPSGSIGWRLSNEKFMSFLKDYVSDWKIRYSVGMVGNDRISSSDYPTEGILSSANYTFGDDVSYGYAASSMSTPDLTWEKTTTHNIGTDIQLFNNTVSLTFDYYIKTTKDLLMAATIASTTGFTTENKNVGSVRNQGYEINLNTNNITHKNFSWQTAFNFSFNKNKVLSLINNNATLYTGFDETVRIKVGRPIYSYYMYHATGVYTTEEKLNTLPKMSTTIIGDPTYEDVNGDGEITADDKTDLGHPDPNYIWGMTNTITLGNFNISILFQGQWGNQILSMYGRDIDRPTETQGFYNIMHKWVNRFRSLDSPGDGKTPRIDASTASLYDSRWLYSGAYYKIKNLTVGYTVRKPKLFKFISSLNAYVSAENLWMHCNYDGGYSPEAFQSTYLSDWSSFPTARTISLGLNVNF